MGNIVRIEAIWLYIQTSNDQLNSAVSSSCVSVLSSRYIKRICLGVSISQLLEVSLFT